MLWRAAAVMVLALSAGLWLNGTELYWAGLEAWESWGAVRLPPGTPGLLALAGSASPRALHWCGPGAGPGPGPGPSYVLVHSGALARARVAAGPGHLAWPAAVPCPGVVLGAGRQRPTSLHWPGLAAHRAWPPPPIAAVLEAAAPAIVAEFHALYRAVDFREKLPQWQAFDLVRRGHWQDTEAARWPATRAALETAAAGHPNISYLYPDRVYFSVLTPGSGLNPHYGFTNTRLRVHLGIDIPEDCGLNVDGRVLHWENGKVLVFDDSYLHWVWNRGNRTRAILLVGIWHPDLSLEEREYLMSHTDVLNF